MSARKSLLHKLSIAAVTFGLVAVSTVLISGQTPSAPRHGVPDDWTHHHLVYSNPGSFTDAVKNGTLENWYRITNSSRYQIQQLKQNPLQRELTAAPDFAARAAILSRAQTLPIHRRPVPTLGQPIAKDWNMNLGATAASQTGLVSGTLTTAADQTIVITNGTNSETLTATPAAATATGTFNGNGFTNTPSGSVTITNGTTSIQLSAVTSGATNACTTGATSRTGSFTASTNNTTSATNFLTLITSANCASHVGISVTRSGAVLTLTATSSGTGGNSINLTDAMNYFSFSGTSLSGGLATTDDSTHFSTSATPATEATHIANAINLNTSTVGVSASTGGTATVTVTATTPGAGGNSITLSDAVANFAWTGGATSLAGGSSATVGAGTYPAKYSFDISAAGQCASSGTPDFVVYNTGVNGTGTQANLIAYDNIYSGCTGTSPSVYWSYETGPGAAITSPVISLLGDKVAFIETQSSGAAILRIVRWKAGDGTDSDSPSAPTNKYTNTTTGTAWSSCPAGSSCMISVAYQNGATNTLSSPWYDYDSDTLWVGDDTSYVHKFTGVFTGTPVEVTTTWPLHIYTASHPMAGPVYDGVHNRLFAGLQGDARFNCIDTSTNALCGTAITVGSTGTGTQNITDPPIVDPSANSGGGQVYVFVAADTGTHAGVYQMTEALGSLVEAEVGTSSTTNPIYAGTFDNTYFNSVDPTKPSGTLWVCGNAGGAPALYPITITSGAMATGVITAAATVSNSTTSSCSPVSEIYNPNNSKDYIFVSPQTQSTSAVSGCTASEGCVLSYTVSGSTATLSGGGAFAGGASGMVVDTQNSGTAGALQIYFSILGVQSCSGNVGTGGSAGTGTGGCAIQASQSTP